VEFLGEAFCFLDALAFMDWCDADRRRYQQTNDEAAHAWVAWLRSDEAAMPVARQPSLALGGVR